LLDLDPALGLVAGAILVADSGAGHGVGFGVVADIFATTLPGALANFGEAPTQDLERTWVIMGWSGPPAPVQGKAITVFAISSNAHTVRLHLALHICLSCLDNECQGSWNSVGHRRSRPNAWCGSGCASRSSLPLGSLWGIWPDWPAEPRSPDKKEARQSIIHFGPMMARCMTEESTHSSV